MEFGPSVAQSQWNSLHLKICAYVIHFENGGFQLEFVSISRVINHMTCYNSSALIGGKLI